MESRAVWQGADQMPTSRGRPEERGELYDCTTWRIRKWVTREVVRTLLETDAAVDTLTNDGTTALKLARQDGHRDMVAVLEQFQQGRTAI